MFVQWLKNLVTRLREDVRGVVVVETVICMPLLFWATAATYEFHEVHRYKSAREKATYTIADMISREQLAITSNYMDRTLLVFDDMANDDGANQIRISVIEYNADTTEYLVRWSQIRGTGTMQALTDAAIAADTNIMPILSDGQQFILVEAKSTYTPVFKMGMGAELDIKTRIFTAPRFVPKIDYTS
jgi:hypothetical protein